MGCGGSGNLGGSSNLGHISSEVLAFLGSLAAQIAVLMASGPVLGFLTSLVLLLAVVALAKFILTRGLRGTRREPLQDRNAP